MKFGHLTLLSQSPAAEANWNMAIDEAILLTSEVSTLRCYRWRRPAVSFGYFVKWDSVAEVYPSTPLVRRWTGGGIVEHGEDFTYSLVIPSIIGQPKTIELYSQVHLRIADALRESGQPVEITASPEDPVSAACFDRAVKFDLKLAGKKIAGAAVRRHQRGILLQGSIQRVTIPTGFETMLAVALSNETAMRPLPLPALNLAAQLAGEKYGSEVWNRRF
jgi:lipoate-protein ligase A